MIGTRGDDGKEATRKSHAYVCQEKWIWKQVGRSCYRSDMLDVSMAWPKSFKDLADILGVYESDLKFGSSNKESGDDLPSSHGAAMLSDDEL